MIQDIAPHKFENNYARRQEPKGTDAALRFQGREVLVRQGGEPSLPTVADFPGETPLTWLFRIDETNYFLYPDGGTVPADCAFQEVRSLFWNRVGGQLFAFAVFTAWHLYNWYQTNQRCGRCGEKTERHGELRALRCPQCGSLIFPRIVPAILAAVTDGDRLLVTKYVNSTFPALIAGFTEIGETLEETVAREVMEEAGVRVKNIRYYASQPWGVDGNVMIGFFCDLDGSPAITIDAAELKEALWLDRKEIPEGLNDYALTYEMMRLFAAGQEPKG